MARFLFSGAGVFAVFAVAEMSFGISPDMGEVLTVIAAWVASSGISAAFETASE